MGITIICDDCRGDMTGDEIICRTCVEEKDTEISNLEAELEDVKSERDDFISRLEDMEKEKEV
jgi:hypothetical protein